MFDHFIGKNDIGLSYDEYLEKYLFKEDEIDDENVRDAEIHNTKMRTFYPIGFLSSDYERVASYYLAKEKNIALFKQHCYTAGYLSLLNCENLSLYIPFSLIMSDNKQLIDYVIKHFEHINYDEKYNPKQDCYVFVIKNKYLALAGKFDELKPRSKMFLEAHNKYNERRVPEHLFYLALVDKDIKKMKESLELLLEPKMARKSVYGIDNAFSFYLQTRVLTLAKIAAHHGYDLGIDYPSAPKELIKIEPLKEYKIEYEFMKEFDFNYPQQVWIDKIKYTDKVVDYWRTKVEEMEKKKRSFLGFKF